MTTTFAKVPKPEAPTFEPDCSPKLRALLQAHYEELRNIYFAETDIIAAERRQMELQNQLLEVEDDLRQTRAELEAAKDAARDAQAAVLREMCK